MRCQDPAGENTLYKDAKHMIITLIYNQSTFSRLNGLLNRIDQNPLSSKERKDWQIEPEEQRLQHLHYYPVPVE